MKTLRCKGISKAFDGVLALDSVSLQFECPGIVAIIGPNGAGKSTLLNVLTGFLQPDYGYCYLGDRDITRLSPHRIARMGIGRTFQDLRLIRQVTSIENVLLARPHQRGESLPRAILRVGTVQEEFRNTEQSVKALEFVGLQEMRYTPAEELSYGQQKLLTVACCLATEAHFLFLDEPVSGVHPEMVARILDILKRLRNEGKLVVFIEHDIASVRSIADSVIVMDEGKVIVKGGAKEVLDRPEIMEAYIA